jgi:hypothetical protein
VTHRDSACYAFFLLPFCCFDAIEQLGIHHHHSMCDHDWQQQQNVQQVCNEFIIIDQEKCMSQSERGKHLTWMTSASRIRDIVLVMLLTADPLPRITVIYD